MIKQTLWVNKFRSLTKKESRGRMRGVKQGGRERKREGGKESEGGSAHDEAENT